MNSKKYSGSFFLFVYFYITKCKAEMEPFIVGGHFTKISKFPHSVFLTVECENTWICGSSILNQKILLTAAHCVFGCKTRWKIQCSAGDEDLSKVNVIREAAGFKIHEKYDDKSMANDIAILDLKRNLPLNRYMKRVIIRRSHPVGVLASVAGWGVTNRETNADSIVLKMATQKVLPPWLCARFGYLGPGKMCAKSPTPNTSPAQGDSGSALITKDFQQLGLVSFIFSDYPNIPVYTNVSYYYDWIRSKSFLLYCD
ncbi:unnamed protein product [Parnassius mnemosyne]|uniref:Peptidase S1 domain-containing protein n=1 Tax=Parnassius mnemosyne TaxID=213953 RepID=A0AAV1KK26_9NEOP